MRIAGPFAHENLAVFFLQDDFGAGAVPLTLDEALKDGRVELVETGTIEALSIENVGDEDVFVQCGDIVKGGKQDRVIKVSTILRPKSGQIPLEALCVESGRWGSSVGRGEMRRFSSSLNSCDRMTKRKAMASRSDDSRYHGLAAMGGRAEAQSSTWREVASRQARLSSSLGEEVRSSASPSSYDLALENEKLKARQDSFTGALSPEDSERPDTIGSLFLINGRLSSAEIYESHGLFGKMWRKNLNACVVDALSETESAKVADMSASDVAAFLSKVETGDVSEAELPSGGWIKTYLAEGALLSEAQRDTRKWVHRHYAAA